VSFLIDGAKVETFFQSTKFFWNFFPTFFHRGLCKVKSHLILYAENATIKKIKKKYQNIASISKNVTTFKAFKNK
jgi:hypothetical protein